MTAQNPEAGQDQEPQTKQSPDEPSKKAGKPRQAKPPSDKTGEKAKQSKGVPPWANFNETQTLEAQMMRTPAKLEPVKNGKRFYCLSNCGNGKYVKGRIYTLPGDSPLAANLHLFREA